jgi:lipopolysaccharide export system protein LptA
MNIKKKSTNVIALAIALLAGWAFTSAQAQTSVTPTETPIAIGSQKASITTQEGNRSPGYFLNP